MSHTTAVVLFAICAVAFVVIVAVLLERAARKRRAEELRNTEAFLNNARKLGEVRNTTPRKPGYTPRHRIPAAMVEDSAHDDLPMLGRAGLLDAGWGALPCFDSSPRTEDPSAFVLHDNGPSYSDTSPSSFDFGGGGGGFDGGGGGGSD